MADSGAMGQTRPLVTVVKKIFFYLFSGMLALFLGFWLLLLSRLVPMGVSDSEIATVGRISYFGFPIWFVGTAPGESLMSAVHPVRLLLNFLFWSVCAFVAIIKIAKYGLRKRSSAGLPTSN
jgi:hypothetical protein